MTGISLRRRSSGHRASGGGGGSSDLIYDASAIVASDGDLVTQLFDQSGNGNDTLGEHGSDIGPRYKVNGLATGKASVRFSGNSMFDLPDLSTLTEVEFFFVLKATNDPAAGDSGSRLCRLGTDPTDKETHYPWTDGSIYDGMGSTVRKSTGNPTVVLTTPHLYNVVSKAGEWTSRINTSVHYTTATNTVGIRSSATLGGTVDGGFIFIGWAGDLSEFRVYSTVRTSPERAAIEAALKTKWGLTGY